MAWRKAARASRHFCLSRTSGGSFTLARNQTAKEGESVSCPPGGKTDKGCLTPQGEPRDTSQSTLGGLGSKILPSSPSFHPFPFAQGEEPLRHRQLVATTPPFLQSPPWSLVFGHNTGPDNQPKLFFFLLSPSPAVANHRQTDRLAKKNSAGGLCFQVHIYPRVIETAIFGKHEHLHMVCLTHKGITHSQNSV